MTSARVKATVFTTSHPLMMYAVDHVPPFFAIASADATTYPYDVFCAWSMSQPPVAGILRQIADTMNDPASVMPEVGTSDPASPGRDVAQQCHAAGGHARSLP